MADLIGLVNEISTSVKLAWVGVLAWSAVQFVWYRRARSFAEATESSSNSWSAGRQFSSVTRPPEPVERPRFHASPSSVNAAAMDLDVDAEFASPSAEGAGFGEAVAIRKKSNRRRRAMANNGPGEGGSVPDFALETPKAT
jgi:hypothetical protein